MISGLLSLVCHLTFERTVWPASTTAWLAVLALGLGPAGGAFYCQKLGVIATPLFRFYRKAAKKLVQAGRQNLAFIMFLNDLFEISLFHRPPQDARERASPERTGAAAAGNRRGLARRWQREGSARKKNILDHIPKSGNPC